MSIDWSSARGLPTRRFPIEITLKQEADCCRCRCEYAHRIRTGSTVLWYGPKTGLVAHVECPEPCDPRDPVMCRSCQDDEEEWYSYMALKGY